MKATYNITDDRLKFWPDRRLTETEYKQVRSLGMSWFPGQKCFSGVWSPGREDFILSFCETIANDENPDDLESRVARFQRYAQNDERDAAAAQERTQSANTPRQLNMAQNTAAKKTEEAQYWHDRIAGAIARAEYRDRPEVIARRIKKLEAEHRKHEREQKEARVWLERWQKAPDNLRTKDGEPVTLKEAALYLANMDYLTIGSNSVWSLLRDDQITPEDAQKRYIDQHNLTIERRARWLAHLDMRLEYERAYLASVAGEQAAEQLTAPKKRQVSKAPDDGLKKGMLATAKGRFTITGKIASLGPKSVKIEVPPDHPNYDYYKRYSGGLYRVARRHVTKAE